MKNLLPILPLLGATLGAGELTIERAPFRIEHRFDATALPDQPHLVSVDPESWEEFVIEEIVEHGSPVTKDQVLIRFDREGYERRIEDLGHEVDGKEVELAIAELELAKLKEETELALGAARRAKSEADDDLTYFDKTGRPAAEAQLAETEKQYRFRLDAEKEELAQLKQMYEEDDLTEATEEIILKRQLVAIEVAEFDLAEAVRENERTRTATLPRRKKDLEAAAQAAAIALEKAEANLPRTLKVAELKVAASATALERERLLLERLKKDEALFEVRAEGDGVFFHGSLEDGQWQLGDLAKLLDKGGRLPLRRVVASVSPADAPISLHARLDPEVRRSLNDGSGVTVILKGREDLALGGKVERIGTVPATDGKSPIRIEVDWPEGVSVTPAATVGCLAVVYENPEAIAVPQKALRLSADGTWGVELKMTEGETRHRVVERGRASDDRIEITDGLEAGQVIVVGD